MALIIQELQSSPHSSEDHAGGPLPAGVRYVCIQSEPGLWTVGFRAPSGMWCPDDDYDSEAEASAMAAVLNDPGARPCRDCGARSPDGVCGKCLSLMLTSALSAQDPPGGEGPACGPLTAGVSMFRSLTTDQANVLAAHLNSGWAKQEQMVQHGQRAGYGEIWDETAALLDDLFDLLDLHWSGRRDVAAAIRAMACPCSASVTA